jgi:hypothetical protein
MCVQSRLLHPFLNCECQVDISTLSSGSLCDCGVPVMCPASSSSSAAAAADACKAVGYQCVLAQVAPALHWAKGQ